MDHTIPQGCEPENRDSTDCRSSCPSIIEATPNPSSNLVCRLCNISFLNCTELVLHRETHSFHNHSILNQNESHFEERKEEDSNTNTTLHNSCVYETCYQSEPSMNETCDIVKESQSSTIQNKSPYEEREEEYSDIVPTLNDNNCGILINETTYNYEPSLNLTSDITGAVVNESDKIVDIELEANNEQLFTNETCDRLLQTVNANPDIIINETDTYNSSENKTQSQHTRLKRQRDYFSESELDFVDDTPAKRQRTALNIEKRRLIKDCRLLYPGKYKSVLQRKKKVDNHEKKSGRPNDISNRKDGSNIISLDYEVQTRLNMSGSSNMNITMKISGIELNSENDADRINRIQFQENVRHGVTERKRGEHHRNIYLSGSERRYESRRSKEFKRGTEINSESKSGSMISFTCMEAMNTPEPSQYNLTGNEFNRSINISRKSTSDSEMLSLTCMESINIRQKITRAHEVNTSTGIYRKSTSDSELLSLTCMESINTQQTTSQDFDKNSSHTETSLDESYVFERNQNVRRNLEDSSLTVVGDSIGSENISKSFQSEYIPVIISSNRSEGMNDGMVISGSNIYDSEIFCDQHHMSVSVSDAEEISNNEECLHQSDQESSFICLESSHSPSTSHATTLIHLAGRSESLPESTLTEGYNLLSHYSEAGQYFDSSDSEYEAPRELTPSEWLDREQHNYIQDWCVGKVRTEFKCKYCQEVWESLDQLSIHVHLKHIVPPFTY